MIKTNHLTALIAAEVAAWEAWEKSAKNEKEVACPRCNGEGRILLALCPKRYLTCDKCVGTGKILQ
jgi:DnaJ-class molecular chaperone